MPIYGKSYASSRDWFSLEVIGSHRLGVRRSKVSASAYACHIIIPSSYQLSVQDAYAYVYGQCRVLETCFCDCQCVESAITGLLRRYVILPKVVFERWMPFLTTRALQPGHGCHSLRYGCTCAARVMVSLGVQPAREAASVNLHYLSGGHFVCFSFATITTIAYVQLTEQTTQRKTRETLLDPYTHSALDLRESCPVSQSLFHSAVLIPPSARLCYRERCGLPPAF